MNFVVADINMPLQDLDRTPCGRFACDGGVQPGHFACEAPPDWALELERAGEIARHYNGTS